LARIRRVKVTILYLHFTPLRDEWQKQQWQLSWLWSHLRARATWGACKNSQGCGKVWPWHR